MADQLALDRGKTALLIMDYQNTVVETYATDQAALLQRAAKALAAARGAGVQVIHVVVGFREGYPEVSARNAGFSGIKQTGRFRQGDKGAEIHPAVAAQPGDITVVKKRVGAFAGSDLEMILRANDIETLVILGIATSGVVLTTVRHAFDLDYRLIVLKDACADLDPEVHRVLTEKVFARGATVVTVDEFVRALEA
jgi:nicotinamidase-related amidase